MKTRGVRTRGGIRQTHRTVRTLGGQKSVTPSHDEGNQEVMLDFGDLDGNVELQNLMDGKENLPGIDDQENEKVISFEVDQLGNNQDYGDGISRDTFKMTVPVTNVLEDILPNDYVIVRYDDSIYPGQVMKCQGANFLIRCMERSGPNWKWPKIVDEIWYDQSDVFKKIDPTGFVPVSNRGHFQIEDELLRARLLAL